MCIFNAIMLRISESLYSEICKSLEKKYIERKNKEI